MRLAEELKAKFEDVADMYSRGLLTVFYMAAWEDAMKISEKHLREDEKPVMVLADECRAGLRMWTQNHVDWSASIRPQSKWLKTEILHGHTYAEVEHKVRECLRMLQKKEAQFRPSAPIKRGAV